MYQKTDGDHREQSVEGLCERVREVVREGRLGCLVEWERAEKEKERLWEGLGTVKGGWLCVEGRVGKLKMTGRSRLGCGRI